MPSQEKNKEQRIRGVFSSQEVRKVGTGTTTRKTVQKVFWFVEEAADGSILVQPMNSNYIPTGPQKTISMDELLEKYSPEPEFYVQSVYPKMKEMEKALSSGDKFRDKGETFSAEYEYSNALKLDEENVRANFGIGLTYLARGETAKADNIFNRLVNLDAAFQGEHKHLFNDFGISLRKNKMYAQAVEYYERALELTQADENLHINLARALLEEKECARCVSHLFEALRLSPGNETAMKFLAWLDSKNLIPREAAAQARAVLAAGEAHDDKAVQDLLSAQAAESKETQADTPPEAGQSRDELEKAPDNS